MKTYKRMMRGISGLLGALAYVSGIAQAAGTIYPVDLANRLAPLTTSTVTVSIYQVNASGVYADVTGTWLPEWSPSATSQSVYVVVNSGGAPVTPSSINLVQPVNPFLNANVSPVIVTTSAYKGQCTNYGSATDLGADFTLTATATPLTTTAGTTVYGYQLIPNDCGGMAVIQAGVGSATNTFILPQDSNVNGIPDIWEKLYGGSLAANADTDAGPSGSAIVGDGIANLDEYRGFIVSGQHQRTAPTQKDLFVHLVNPQCGAASLLGGSNPTYPTDATGLFANLNTLISGSQIRMIGYAPGSTNYTSNEWIDNFASFDIAKGFVYQSGTDGKISDRQINGNAVYPVLDVKTSSRVQKGVRLTECVDTIYTSPLGIAGWGSPNGAGGDSIIFTKRLVNYITNLIGSSTSLYLSTFQNGVWTSPALTTKDAVLSQAIRFVAGMEIGHSIQLTPTATVIKTINYGYHYAPGTGDDLDQSIVSKANSPRSGNVTFQIPSAFGSADQSNFRLNN